MDSFNPSFFGDPSPHRVSSFTLNFFIHIGSVHLRFDPIFFSPGASLFRPTYFFFPGLYCIISLVLQFNILHIVSISEIFIFLAVPKIKLIDSSYIKIRKKLKSITAHISFFKHFFKTKFHHIITPGNIIKVVYPEC